MLGKEKDSCEVELVENNGIVESIKVQGLAKNWTFFSEKSPIGIWFPHKEYEFEIHEFDQEDIVSKFQQKSQNNKYLLQSENEVQIGLITYHPKIKIELTGNKFSDLSKVETQIGVKGLLSTAIECDRLTKIQ